LSLYAIIIALFIVAGLIVSIWGWQNIRKNRQSLDWPSVTGHVQSSQLSVNITPDIQYSYQVDGVDYEQTMKFPDSMISTPDVAKLEVEKYPVGKQVTVYYPAEAPENSTLTPGPGKDAWLIVVMGILAIVFGCVLLLFSL